MKLRVAAAFIAGLLVLAGCQVATEAPPTPGPAEYGDPAILDSFDEPEEIEPDVAPPNDGDGKFVISVVDQDGNTPSDIPVEFSGPIKTIVLTNAKGEANFTGPAGPYGIRVIEGCTDVMQVLAGGNARAGVAAGKSGDGQLFVQWRTRNMPGGLVVSDSGGDWPRGKAVTVKFEVQDRCRGLVRAPNASFARLAYTNLMRLKLSGKPKMASDAEGFATVTVICTSAGPPGLVIHDPQNPKDFFDLVANDATTGVSPRCL